jgi:hypothetical protein
MRAAAYDKHDESRLNQAELPNIEVNAGFKSCVE